MEKLHNLFDGLHSLTWIHSSICWQQSRLIWLREGDANSKKKFMVLCPPGVGLIIFRVLTWVVSKLKALPMFARRCLISFQIISKFRM